MAGFVSVKYVQKERGSMKGRRVGQHDWSEKILSRPISTTDDAVEY